MGWWKGTQYWLHLLAIDRYQVRNSLANICFHFIALIWGYHHLGKDMYDVSHQREDLQHKKKLGLAHEYRPIMDIWFKNHLGM
jgi:hypothetical protein